MKDAFRTGVTYLAFAALSGIIHFAILTGGRTPAPQTPSAPPPAVLTMVASPAPEKKEIEEDPTPPLFREAMEKDPEVKTADRTEEEKLREEKKPEPAKRELPLGSMKPSPTKEAPKPTLQDYRTYLEREMPRGGTTFQYVPKLRFTDNTDQENLEIMRYFGMELIAYPPDRSYYVHLDPAKQLFRKSTDFEYLKNFSNRAIFRESAWFRAQRDAAAKQVRVPSDALVVAQLLKPATARYIEWKQKKAADAARVALEDVATCEATFVRIPAGVWIARIDALVLRDGRRVEARDAEWEKWK